MENFEELINKKEDLHPDLAPYLEKTKYGHNLRHPLVYSLFYNPQMNAMLNNGYKYKLEYSTKAFEENDFSKYVWLHERPYRMSKFIEIKDILSDKDYWELLGSIWSDSENLWQYHYILEHLLTQPRDGRENMMSKEEKKFLATLPEEFVIYRGHQGRNKLGYSWSLSYPKARWFSQRFQLKTQGVVKGIINKKDVIACLLGRGEFEIVCSPINVKEIKPVVSSKRPDWIESLLTKILSEVTIKKSSHHGLWHWEKVEKNALALGKKTKGCDLLVVRLFALIHDSKRINENDDEEHGLRAAKYAEKLHKEKLLKISESQLKELMEACEFHEAGKTTSNPTIGVCWDADRLDLPRVGIIPNPKLLSTQAGKDLLWKI